MEGKFCCASLHLGPVEKTKGLVGRGRVRLKGTRIGVGELNTNVFNMWGIPSETELLLWSLAFVLFN